MTSDDEEPTTKTASAAPSPRASSRFGRGLLIGGRYEVVERIGKGAMGVVYRARHANVGRDVAIKVLTSAASQNPSMVERFENEARIISNLHHPNTLRLFDVGQDDNDQFYIVTEFLEGRSLEQILRGGALSVLATLSIMKQVCGSLAEAHAKGIVHRDLKPGNIFIQEIAGQEIAKVLDFGIARFAGWGPVTVAGSIFGTPAYMSPEQVNGETVDARSDLYSLGIIAYQCIAGRRPFGGDSPSRVLIKHVAMTPEPLSDLNLPHALPPRLVTLIHRLLEKRRDDRPESALAVAEVVDDLLASLRVERREGREATGVVPPRLADEVTETPEAHVRPASASDVAEKSGEQVARNVPTMFSTAAWFGRSRKNVAFGAVVGFVLMFVAPWLVFERSDEVRPLARDDRYGLGAPSVLLDAAARGESSTASEAREAVREQAVAASTSTVATPTVAAMGTVTSRREETSIEPASRASVLPGPTMPRVVGKRVPRPTRRRDTRVDDSVDPPTDDGKLVDPFAE